MIMNIYNAKTELIEAIRRMVASAAKEDKKFIQIPLEDIDYLMLMINRINEGL